MTTILVIQANGQTSNKIYLADSLLKKSLENLLSDNLTEAIIISNQSLKIHEEYKNEKGIAKSLYVLAQCHTNLSEFEKAYSYATQSLKIFEKIKDTTGIADCYEDIGNYFEFSKKDMQKALECYSIGIKYSEAINYKKGRAYFLGNIARVYARQNLFEKALENNFESLKLKEELNDQKGMGFSLHKIGQIYFKLGNLVKAKEYAQKCMDLAKTNNHLENVKRSADLLSLIYKQQGNYRLASEMFELYIKSRDSINNISLQKIAVQKEMQYEFNKQQTADSLKIEEERRINLLKFEQEKVQRYYLYAGLLLIAVFAGIMFNRFRITQRQKIIIEHKEKETQRQKHLIEEKQKEITDSITYAKRLQQAILPPAEFITHHIPKNFVVYKPKDIVAGDFYWAEKVGEMFFIAAADSTGHGVPGAMVSVVCSNALNRTIKEFKLTETGKILDKTRELVLETFEKSTSEVKDGMDISLLCIDSNNNNIFWSGANNPLWYIQDNKLKEIKADKQPIGKSDYPKPFTTHQIEYKENTTFYLFTDGLADQFGGPNGKKFKYKQFSDLLIKNNNLSQKQQADLINKAFSDWKGDLEQVDDVCVIGVKL